MLLPAMDEESLKKFEADVKDLQAKVETTEKAKFCPNCGKPYRNDTVKFCANCGTKRG